LRETRQAETADSILHQVLHSNLRNVVSRQDDDGGPLTCRFAIIKCSPSITIVLGGSVASLMGKSLPSCLL
jgi:hypothetical protein